MSTEGPYEFALVPEDGTSSSWSTFLVQALTAAQYRHWDTESSNSSMKLCWHMPNFNFTTPLSPHCQVFVGFRAQENMVHRRLRVKRIQETLQRTFGSPFYYAFQPLEFHGSNVDLKNHRGAFQRVYQKNQKTPVYHPKTELDPQYQKKWLQYESPNLWLPHIPSSLDGSPNEDRMIRKRVESWTIHGHEFQLGFFVALVSLDPIRFYVHDDIQLDICQQAAFVNCYQDAYPDPLDVPALADLFHAEKFVNHWRVIQHYLTGEGLDSRRLTQEIHELLVKLILGFSPEFRPTTDKDTGITEVQVFQIQLGLEDIGRPHLISVHTLDESHVTNPSTAKTKLLHHVVTDFLSILQWDPRTVEQKIPGQGALDCRLQCQPHEKLLVTPGCWHCPSSRVPQLQDKGHQKMLMELQEEVFIAAPATKFQLLYPSIWSETSFFRNYSTPPLDRFLLQPSSRDTLQYLYLEALLLLKTQNSTHPSPPTPLQCMSREECSNHGQCVNGQCQCDNSYEGRTCVVPKPKRIVTTQGKSMLRDGHYRLDDLDNSPSWNGLLFLGIIIIILLILQKAKKRVWEYKRQSVKSH